VLVPLVLLIIAIALYPQFGLKRSEKSVSAVTAPVTALQADGDGAEGAAAGATPTLTTGETP
jgi:hypothetical protein